MGEHATPPLRNGPEHSNSTCYRIRLPCACFYYLPKYPGLVARCRCLASDVNIRGNIVTFCLLGHRSDARKSVRAAYSAYRGQSGLAKRNCAKVQGAQYCRTRFGSEVPQTRIHSGDGNSCSRRAASTLIGKPAGIVVTSPMSPSFREPQSGRSSKRG